MLTLILVALLALPDPGVPAFAPPLPAGLEAPPWADLVVDQCKEKLAATGLTGRHFRFSKETPIRARKSWQGEPPIYCHVPQATVLWNGPTGVQYLGFTTMSCAMTLALTRMERIAQEEARRVFGRPDGDNPIRAIAHLGTFNCRTQRFKAKQSQHSFGNGIDLAGFDIKGVGQVWVKYHWKPYYPKAYARQSEFLHALARRLREEEVFTNVLDPDYDPSHWNHIHVDLAPTSDGEPSAALRRAKTMPTPLAGDLHVAPVP